MNGDIGDRDPDRQGDDAVRAVVGQLAETARRRVLAAVELGAATPAAIAAATGLDVATIDRAVTKLAADGIVADGETGFAVDDRRFHDAARALLARPASTEHDAHPAAIRKVLAAFVRNGVLAALPMPVAKRRIVLEWVADRFEPGRLYDEREVNELLAPTFADVATLRRALVDDELLDRADGHYWRCGGPVDGADEAIAMVDDRP